jgi:hypothetical protein
VHIDRFVIRLDDLSAQYDYRRRALRGHLQLQTSIVPKRSCRNMARETLRFRCRCAPVRVTERRLTDCRAIAGRRSSGERLELRKALALPKLRPLFIAPMRCLSDSGGDVRFGSGLTRSTRDRRTAGFGAELPMRSQA